MNELIKANLQKKRQHSVSMFLVLASIIIVFIGVWVILMFVSYELFLLIFFAALARIIAAFVFLGCSSAAYKKAEGF